MAVASISSSSSTVEDGANRREPPFDIGLCVTRSQIGALHGIWLARDVLALAPMIFIVIGGKRRVRAPPASPAAG